MLRGKGHSASGRCWGFATEYAIDLRRVGDPVTHKLPPAVGQIGAFGRRGRATHFGQRLSRFERGCQCFTHRVAAIQSDALRDGDSAVVPRAQTLLAIFTVVSTAPVAQSADQTLGQDRLHAAADRERRNPQLDQSSQRRRHIGGVQ